MSEIARRDEHLAALTTFAEVARATHAVAVSLAATAFVPASMRGRPEEVTGAILAGNELGLAPMAALRSIDIIDGTPSIRANTMRGLLLAAGGETELVEASDTRVVMRARRSAGKAWQESIWTIDRAKKAGLAGKKNWLAHPQAMMIARCTSELVRLVGADLLIGMPYSTEELTDEVTEALHEPAPASKPVARTAQRALPPTAPEPTPEPELVPETPPAIDRPSSIKLEDSDIRDTPRRAIEAPPSDAGLDPNGKIYDTTRKAIMAGFNELGIKDRNARLAKVSDLVGREIHSVNMLTEREARRVVAALQAERNPVHDAPPSDYEWPEMATPAVTS